MQTLKKKVKTLSKQMIEKDFVVAFIHGGMGLTQRESIMEKFRTCSILILISTDLLARMIYTEKVSLVINYDMPTNYKDYMYRIRCSMRFGRKSVAISFVKNSDIQFLKNIEQFYNTTIKELPDDLSHLL